MRTGYQHPDYAQSLQEFGTPRPLPRSGGTLLERTIPHSTLSDAMGCYPLFCCADWSQLKPDLDDLVDKYVTIVLVADPFAPIEPDQLRDTFDLVHPVKNHFVLELAAPVERQVSRHHRYYARKSLRSVKVEVVAHPIERLDDWVRLYNTLSQRYRLTGIKAFSREAFASQLGIPGMVMFAATCGAEVVGAQLWYIQGAVAHSHLTAVSEQGYATRAAYAIYWTAIQFFKEHPDWNIAWLDLGAAAGISGQERSGLSQFKEGWSSETRPKYLCGRICQPEQYTFLCQEARGREETYFPCYRRGELA